MSAFKDTNLEHRCRAVPPHSLCVRADSGDDEVLIQTSGHFAAALQQRQQQLRKQQPWLQDQQHQQTSRPPCVTIVEDAAAAKAKAAFERADSPLSLMLQLQLQLVVASAVLLLRAAGPRLRVLRLARLRDSIRRSNKGSGSSKVKRSSKRERLQTPLMKEQDCDEQEQLHRTIRLFLLGCQKIQKLVKLTAAKFYGLMYAAPQWGRQQRVSRGTAAAA
ncbi:hypothetical protein Emed_004368 [Eimeria media]